MANVRAFFCSGDLSGFVWAIPGVGWIFWLCCSLWCAYHALARPGGRCPNNGFMFGLAENHCPVVLKPAFKLKGVDLFVEFLDGKRVFIRRDREDQGFDGVVTQVRGKWIYVAVADPDPDGFDGIWVNTDLQREIAVLK